MRWRFLPICRFNPALAGECHNPKRLPCGNVYALQHLFEQSQPMAKIVPLLLIAAAAYAQLERPTPAVNPNSISVVLASPSGTTTYRAGDRITVQLTFLSSGVATEMNGSDYGGPTGLEKIVIAPSNGAVAWAGDQSGTSKYFPDYFMKTPLSATHPVHLKFRPQRDLSLRSWSLHSTHLDASYRECRRAYFKRPQL